MSKPSQYKILDAYIARTSDKIQDARDEIDCIKDAMETETDPRKYQNLKYLLRVAEAELESRKDHLNLLKGHDD